jgi:2-polyprenyl-6-methoxyphenol hydroxylase-like FAD-dependent oxidoreductase
MTTLATTCCVVGGGPAGMMLGYLLARDDVPVIVLEKHADFFRDFRGDTVHPSTLELFHELGLLDDFLKLPHQKLQSIRARFGDFEFQVADLRHVPAHCKFVALMPQWDFLNFLAGRGKDYSSFDLRMQHEAIGLVRDGERITGVEVRTSDGVVDIRADLVVACDGRHSITRKAAQLETQELGVPVDVLWFRNSRKPNDPEQMMGGMDINYGKALVLISRGDYFQAGLIVEKGSFDQIKRAGLEAFGEDIAKIAPYLADRVQELQDWEQINLLTVQINRLRRWYAPGLLCIGDAAHAMSPAGGVGINLAVQDAVATANRLAIPLREKRVTEAELAAVQKRREFPTRVTQFLQFNIHNAFAARVFPNKGPARAPWQLKVAVRAPGVQRALGYVIGIGVRPEHIRRSGKRAWGWGTIAACGAVVTAGAIAAALMFRPKSRQGCSPSNGGRGPSVSGIKNEPATPTMVHI